MNTLGQYRALYVILKGEDSAAVRFLDEKIAESPRGHNEEVIMPESQVIYLLESLK